MRRPTGVMAAGALGSAPRSLRRASARSRARGVGRLQPAEGGDVLHAAGFQREDDLGEIEALDLGQFLRGALQVLALGPEAQGRGRGRCGPARPAR